MNEIEKLYENVRVKPFRYCYNCFDNNGNRIENSANCPSRHNCSNTCDTPEYEFTAEKELALIRWFIHSRHFSPERYCAPWMLDDIARHINFFWEILTSEEKQQIKEILE